MRDKLKLVRQIIQKLSTHFIIALVIVGLLVFMGLFLWQSLQIQKMQNQYNTTQADLALLQERNDLMQEHLDFYKGPGYMLYVEKVAREALNMVKPGETVVLAVQPEGDRVAAASQPANSSEANGGVKTGLAPGQTAPQKTKSNWQNWLAFFIGNN
jgi:cell division protein FtsB